MFAGGEAGASADADSVRGRDAGVRRRHTAGWRAFERARTRPNLQPHTLVTSDNSAILFFDSPL